MPSGPIYPVTGDAEGDATNAELLDGQEGAYYLARANHTGTQLAATISNFDATVTAGTHANRTDNPHAVTKSQVGLSNADNTSDADKPISTATQAALDTKAPTSRALTAGAGLTGGGDLSADRTFNVAANADGSIVVNSDDVQVGVLATDTQHGVRGGGTQHAAATGGAAGFMSAADKAESDRRSATISVVDQDHTVLATERYIGVSGLTADRTVTLPAVASVADGFDVVIKDEDGSASTNGIIIDGSGSEAIDGELTQTIDSAYGALHVVKRGAGWFIV